MLLLRSIAGAVCLGALFPCALTAQSQATSPSQPLTLTQAIRQAMANEPSFVTARVEQQVQALERTNARAALLPTATFHNQAIYTKPNGAPTGVSAQPTNAPAPAFIASNAIREYASQGVFDEKFGLAQFAAIRLADANAARASAELEIARRGLVNTVVTLYDAVAASSSKLTIAEEALAQADHFVQLTQQREAQREAAHADVLKALLVQQQRQRELLDARTSASRARLQLAVLLYSDPHTPFNVELSTEPSPLPDRAAITTLAQTNNPQLKSALASLQSSHAETLATQAELLPELALNFTYGIDATNFAVNGPGGIHNLGYSISAQLDIPVWNWLSTERKIKQSHLREDAARLTLTAAQRRAVADLELFYQEANAAYQQLASLNASVATAKESLRLTELRYLNGESTAFELADAQSTLTSSENAQTDGSTRYQTALANLQTLTGTL